MVGVEMSFSLVINHTPWIPERCDALERMYVGLAKHSMPYPFLLNDTDYRGTDWQVSKVKWALDQWRWSAQQPATHHVFMTDDLNIVSNFWRVLDAMVTAQPLSPIGLLSNHPKGPETYRAGAHAYCTASWLVGPAYVLPHEFLVKFLAWFESLSFEEQKYANDDSSINQFVSKQGMVSLHPLPTIIEHRHDLVSTVGHGDNFSRERLSWRAERWTEGTGDGGFAWHEKPIYMDLIAMTDPEYWRGDWPLLKVGE